MAIKQMKTYKHIYIYIYTCIYIYTDTYTHMYMYLFFYSFIYLPAPPNYPLRYPKYHLIETIRPLKKVHWGGAGICVYVPEVASLLDAVRFEVLEFLGDL